MRIENPRYAHNSSSVTGVHRWYTESPMICCAYRFVCWTMNSMRLVVKRSLKICRIHGGIGEAGPARPVNGRTVTRLCCVFHTGILMVHKCKQSILIFIFDTLYSIFTSWWCSVQMFVHVQVEKIEWLLKVMDWIHTGPDCHSCCNWLVSLRACTSS